MRTKLSRSQSARPYQPPPPSSRPTKIVDKTRPLDPAPGFSHWRVVTVAPRMEDKAAQSIREAGWVVWYPQLTCWISSARTRTKAKVNRPLFPRYVFVAGAGNQSLGSCDHVGYLLPAPASDISSRALHRLIQNLSDRQQAGEFDATIEPPAFEQGEAVTLTEGPFRDFTAIIAKDEGERCRILVEFMGKVHKLRVATSDLVRVA
jgi:transcription antitermination factor NusG